MKLKKGDSVIVLVGKDRGKTGIVDRINYSTGKVVVKGINIVKKHQKKTQARPQSGIIEKYAPLAACKLMIICPTCSKPTRVGYLIANNKKIRICRICQSSLDNVSLATNESKISQK